MEDVMNVGSIRNMLKPNSAMMLMMAIMLSIAFALFVTPRAVADFATPFLQTADKVGDVSEEHGYVVALDLEMEDCKHYLVIVTNDNMQHIVIEATADKNVVKASLLGRQVTIKAQVAVREEDPDNKRVVLKLKILSVKPLKQ